MQKEGDTAQRREEPRYRARVDGLDSRRAEQAGVQRTDVSEGLTATSAVRSMASVGPILLPRDPCRLASVWSGLMPKSEMPFSLATVASIVADSVSRLLYRMSVTVSEAVTFRASAIAVIPSAVKVPSPS